MNILLAANALWTGLMAFFWKADGLMNIIFKLIFAVLAIANIAAVMSKL